MSEIDLLLKLLLFPSLDEDGGRLSDSLYTDLNRVDDRIIDPIGDFLEKSDKERILAKGGPDSGWNEVIGTPRVQLSKEFLEGSQARLERVAVKIRAMFGEAHEEEAEEAIEIAKSMLASERQAFGA